MGFLGWFSTKANRSQAREVISDVQAAPEGAVGDALEKDGTAVTVPPAAVVDSSLSKSLHRPHADVYRDHISKALAKRDSSCLDATILRTGSVDGRDLMAWQCSAGELTQAQLLGVLEAFRDPVRCASTLPVFSRLSSEWAIRLARVMALQEIEPDDRWNAMSLFEAILRTHGKLAVKKKDARLFLEVAVAEGDIARRDQILAAWSFREEEIEYALCDCQNPFTGNGDTGIWLNLFNSTFVAGGIEPIFINEGKLATGSVFDAIECDCSDQVANGPLVSVVVTCWHPDEGLITAVSSILAQTWKNIEVLVVDDASPPEFDEVLAACARLSDKVRIIRHTVNGGTYVGRNTAISLARGEFVTFQDSDDWSHPRRIEHQVRCLTERPELIANRTRAIRVTEQMMTVLPGSQTVQGNASSLLFRREPVVGRIGYFDSVRKGADTEYALRIAAAFPGGMLDMDGPAFAVIRLNSNSLSRSEFKPGWRHPARTAYREAYDHWHKEIRSGEAGPFMAPASELVTRPFPAPRRFWLDQALARSDNAYDFVFVGDWRSYGGPQKSMIEEIRALRESGKRIAICHLEAFRFMTKERQPNCFAIRDMIHRGEVDEVLLSDDLRVGCLVLRYPPILQFMVNDRASWAIKKAMVVINQAPHEADGSDMRYNVCDAMRNFRRVFGCDATWAPQGPVVRKVVEPLIAPHMLAAFDVVGIISTAEWMVPTRILRELPIIGRYSRDNRLKFPSSKEGLLQAYPADDKFDVRIMGGLTACSDLLGEGNVPSNWTMLGYNEVPVTTFLSLVDYFVYFDNDEIIEAFGRSILEAMAAGCVVIVDEKFDGVFSDGVIYAKAAEVVGIVTSIHADPARYQALSEKAIRRVNEHFSYGSYVRKMMDFSRDFQ